jgi:hypothetical protein
MASVVITHSSSQSGADVIPNAFASWCNFQTDNVANIGTSNPGPDNICADNSYIDSESGPHNPDSDFRSNFPFRFGCDERDLAAGLFGES